jgi:hypothetical protein
MSRFDCRLQNRRRGGAFVVVIGFLALGLSLGIAFFFKAVSVADASRKFREAGQGGRAAGVTNGAIGSNDDESPPQPYDLFNFALGQAIYDVADDETGVYSAMRGHGIARSMYGWKDAATAFNEVNNPLAPPPPAYSGFGRTHFAEPNLPGGVDDFNLINYTRFPTDAFIRFPERVPTAAGQTVPSANYIAKNRPITYPDENDVYLAAVRADGYVLVPSFHRPWLAGSPPSSVFPAGSPMWTNIEGKYRILRPRPGAVDGHVNFPQMTANNVPIDPAQRIDSWGDVENLEGKNIIVNGVQVNARQLDSIWIDLGYPVRKYKGRMYKPLFAFLIVDLDGRVNANTAMNLKGDAGGTVHTSNQGWGPWEVNMNYLMSGVTGNPLFQGNQLVGGAGNTLLRRYGTDRPTRVYSLDNSTPQTATQFQGVPFYSRMDFDGSALTNFGSPARMELPTAATRYYTSPVVAGPVNWAPRYGNGNTVVPALTGERDNHSLIYNPYLVPQRRPSAPTPNDRAFGPEEMFYLNGKPNNDQGAYGNSDMAQTATQLRTASFGTNSNPRMLLTSISNDIGFPGIRPWRTPSGAIYQKGAPGTLAAGGPIGSPAAGPAPSGANSDFDPNWRSFVTALRSIDVNRKLTDYRDPARIGAPFEDTNLGALPVNGSVNFARAQADRQALARDIFERLAAATGAWKPQDAFPAAATVPEIDALRQLGQMAVNIVDYIDNDDYMTPFQWNAYPGVVAVETLWGTELPRLVLNEVYVEAWNRGMIPNGQANGWTNNGNNHFEIYAELLNTLTPAAGTDPALSHGGAAPLRALIGGNDIQVYRLKILRNNNFDPQLRAENNLTGDLNPPNTQIVNDLAPAPTMVTPYRLVAPSNATAAGPPAGGTNPGFYVIGPQAQIPGSDNVQVSHQTNQLDMQTLPDPNGNQQPLDAAPTVLLQRLACPHLPFDAVNNPYITVDYTIMPNGSVYDFRQANGNAANPPPVAARNTAFSYGRSQPNAANATRLATQPKNMPAATEINHSFFKQNTNADNPFDWLVHLDRQLVSPIELLNVSAWKPHELTQQFIKGDNPLTPAMKHLHMADWGQSGNPAVSSSHRLYRLFAMLNTRDRTEGMAFGGRIPGRININTIWDPQTLLALCDPNSGNFFQSTDIYLNPTDITAIWPRFKGQRSPFIGTGGTAVWTNMPTTLGDRPFLPAPNFVPPGDGQLGTPLPEEDVRRSLLGSGLFANNTNPVAASHPYLRNEMLNKIFNNVSTRSNTFAVWCTIGYFEVDPSSRPPFTAANRPKLGAELDLDIGTNIRHKFFAIVDRTNLTIDPSSTPTRMLQGSRPVFLSYEPVNATNSVLDPDPDTTTQRNNIVVRVPATSIVNGALMGTYDGETWRIRAGDAILLDVGANQVIASVTAVGPPPGVPGPSLQGIGGNITINLPAVVAPNPASRHIRGAPMQLAIPNLNGNSTTFARLGNPGPQPGFNISDQRYSGVVRFFAEVKR